MKKVINSVQVSDVQEKAKLNSEERVDYQQKEGNGSKRKKVRNRNRNNINQEIMEEMRQSSSSIFILVKSTDKCTNKCTDKCSEKRSGSIYVFLTAMWSSTQKGP